MKCAHCDMGVHVEATGPEDSEILIISFAPNSYDERNKFPFLKPDDAILRTELSMVGYPLLYARQIFMWQHAPVDDESHVNKVVADVMHEMKDRTHVLMVGSQLAKFFTKTIITEINGMEMESMLTPNDVGVTYVYDPAMASNKSVGEFRLAIQKFVERIGGTR